MTHRTPYPILKPSDMVPREEMQDISRAMLPPLQQAEIANLQRGIEHRCVFDDTPKNRHAVTQWAMIYQMIAYQEGWEFQPDLYKVEFVKPGTIKEHGHKRVYSFDRSAPGLSEGNRVGYAVDDRTGAATQMAPKHADDVGELVNEIYTSRRYNIRLLS